MNKERESTRETFKIALLETDLELSKFYLDFIRHLQSRKGAANVGAVSGIEIVIGEWEIALCLSTAAILCKAIAVRTDFFEERIRKGINKRERRLKELKTDPHGRT